jgi:hypothetical protein
VEVDTTTVVAAAEDTAVAAEVRNEKGIIGLFAFCVSVLTHLFPLRI